MGKIATKGWINVNKKNNTFPISEGSQCPTSSEIATKTGFTVSSGYASNQLVQEVDINYSPPISLLGLTIIGTPGSRYYIARSGYVSTGRGMFSPIELYSGDYLSNGDEFEFGVTLYLRNIRTNVQFTISAANNFSGNTVTIDLQP